MAIHRCAPLAQQFYFEKFTLKTHFQQYKNTWHKATSVEFAITSDWKANSNAHTTGMVFDDLQCIHTMEFSIKQNKEDFYEPMGCDFQDILLSEKNEVQRSTSSMIALK